MTDFSVLKWSSVNDEWTKTKFSWLGDFRSLTNPHNHCIEIATYRVKRNNKNHTFHTIKIACGPYGEAGESIEMPVGTRLKKAKKEAIKIAFEIESEGIYFFKK